MPRRAPAALAIAGLLAGALAAAPAPTSCLASVDADDRVVAPDRQPVGLTILAPPPGSTEPWDDHAAALARRDRTLVLLADDRGVTAAEVADLAEDCGIDRLVVLTEGGGASLVSDVLATSDIEAWFAIQPAADAVPAGPSGLVVFADVPGQPAARALGAQATAAGTPVESYLHLAPGMGQPVEDEVAVSPFQRLEQFWLGRAVSCAQGVTDRQADIVVDPGCGL